MPSLHLACNEPTAPVKISKITISLRRQPMARWPLRFFELSTMLHVTRTISMRRLHDDCAISVRSPRPCPDLPQKALGARVQCQHMRRRL